MSKQEHFFDWLKNQYIESVNFSGSERFKNIIKHFPKEAPKLKYPLCGFKRIESFLYLKTKYSFDPDGYVTGVLWGEIGGTKDNTHSHFAYVYWKKNIHNEIHTSLNPEYISISPTFDSRDGEYRKRFITYETFMLAYNAFSEELSQFEDAIVEIVGENKLALHITFFPYDEKLAQEYKHSRLLLKIFAYSLALDLWEYHTGLLLNHTNSKYKKIINRIGGDYPKLIMLSKSMLQKNEKIYLNFTQPTFTTEIHCGQKIIPLYYNEIMNVEDYNLSSWREVNINKLISDLVLNYITPSFPLYGDWTYIFDSDLSLFENDAMHNKYAISDICEYTIHKLREAREKINTIDAETDLFINPISSSQLGLRPLGAKNNIADDDIADDDIADDNIADGGAEIIKVASEEEHIEAKSEFMSAIIEEGVMPNYNTNEYNAMLYEDIEYSHSNLIMSKIALLNVVEDVGWTLFSVNNYITKSLNHIPVIRNLMANKDISYHYIFNYLYAAYSMHAKLHIVHSDIHSNNLTINLWGGFPLSNDIDDFIEPDSFDKIYKKATVVYATGANDTDIYLFPATGINATIIDFSRALIGPGLRSKLQEDGRGEQYATNFYRDQVNKVMAAFNRYAPTFVVQNQEAIKSAILSNFELVFPVLCCIDCMAIGGCLVNYFETSINQINAENNKGSINIKKSIIKSGRGGKNDAYGNGRGGKTPKKKKSKKELKSATMPAKLFKSQTQIKLDKFIPILLVEDYSSIESFIASKKLAQEIEKMGRELLIKGLSEIVNFVKGEKSDLPNIKSPAKVIIDALFAQYNLTNIDSNTKYDIVDGYNFNNELKYSGSHYKKFPPWANIDNIEKNLNGHKMENIFPYGLHTFLENKNKKKIYTDIAAEAIKAESEKLDGRPMYRESSWIN
jgi:hypothetical protein